MAIKSLNSTAGFSVGDTLIQVIASNTDVTTSNLTVTGNATFSGANVTLGSVSNLHISGGTTGYVLQTDGSGTLSWVAQAGGPGGSPGGSNTQVQFNDASSFGGNAGFTFNKTTTTVTANNFVATSTANLGSISNVTITSGTANQVISTNGSGALSWTTVPRLGLVVATAMGMNLL